MPNGKEFLNDLELEREIKGMSDRQLSEFTARQVYDISILSTDNRDRIRTLEKRGRKYYGISGGIGATITGIVIGVIEYFRNRPG